MTSGCSSMCVSWSDRGGGWGCKTPCIKCINKGYSKPRGAESGEESFTPAESSWVFLGDVILDSDWLTKFMVFWCWKLTGCRQFFGFGQKPSVFGNVLSLGTIIGNVKKWARGLLQCIKIGSGLNVSFSALWDFFVKKFLNFFPGFLADKYYCTAYLWRLWTFHDACGDCFHLRLSENLVRQCIKMGYSSVYSIKFGYCSVMY